MRPVLVFPPMLISVALLGLLASLDPLRPAVFVMLLRTDKGRVNAIGFFVGWAFALAVLFAVGFVAFNDGETGRPTSAHKVWLSVLELILAAVLMVVTVRRWHRRHETTHRGPPAPILRQLDRLTPRRSGFLGVLIQPRSLTIAAAIVVARDRSGFADATMGLAVFALLSTGALLGLFTYVVSRPDRAASWLATVTDWIEESAPMLFTIACALGSVFLLADGVRGVLAG